MVVFPWCKTADNINLFINKKRMTMEEKVKIAKEIEKMEYEPLMPIEKKLILYSIVLGVALLAIMVFISHTYFPV